MYRHRIRPPGGNRLGLVGHAGIAGTVSNLFTKALASVSTLAARGRMVIFQSGFGYVTTDPPPTGWTVPPQLFQQGSGQTSDLKPTVPNAYAPGGTFDVDSSGTALPNGMTLATDGVLSVGSATTGASGVVFGYNEPGALPILTLHNAGATATLPYMATVYPTEGAVPAGRFLVSPDDPNLRSSTLSTWPDGSAQVMVVASRGVSVPNGTKTIRLRPNGPGESAGTALTFARIQQLVSAITVNFTGTPQTPLDITTATPDWTWWANSEVVCARYRMPINGKGAMEAVIDIHAFAGGRAFVEVVIENGKVNADAATVATVATQTYTNATVSVTPAGGSPATIATVSSPSAGMVPPRSRPRAVSGYTWAGGHRVGRAWYCAAEVNGGTVTAKTANDHHALFGLEVTHDTTSLQAHPWGFKPVLASTQNLATKYEQNYDRYEPWSTGRLRIPSMSGGGDDEQLTAFTEEQADYVVTANKIARRAIIAHGLHCLSLAFNWRHDGTGGNAGHLPTLAQMTGKTYRNTAFTWPIDSTEPNYGSSIPLQDPHTSHLPFIGVYHFLCRPSPCFIEVAQKEFCWQVLGNAVSRNDPAHWEAQTLNNGQRAFANGVRNYGAAWFITPSSQTTRKADIASAIHGWFADIKSFHDKPWNTLKVIYGGTAPSPNDTALHNQTQHYQMQYVSQVLLMLSAVKPLTDAAQAAVLNAVTATHLDIHPRFINDAIAGEWRAVLYYQYTGEPVGNFQDMGSGSMQALNRLDWIDGADGAASLAEGGKRRTFGAAVPAERGPLLAGWYLEPHTWAAMVGLTGNMDYNEGSTGYYPALYWASLVAAVEFGTPGAEAAWTRVMGNSTRTNWDANAGITNLSEFLSPFARFPRTNVWPRNKP
jgi:hypothetical protein